jgi:hypothetical protein
MRKNISGKIALFGILALLVVLTVPSASAVDIYLRPDPVLIPDGECHSVTVDVLMDSPGETVNVWGTWIQFDPTCVNITGYEYKSDMNGNTDWQHKGDRIKLWNYKAACSQYPDETVLVRLTVHCENPSYCESPLNFIDNGVPPDKVVACLYDERATTWHDGTIIQGTTELPDLVVDKSVEVGADGNFVVSYTVTNIGGGDAGPSTTCKYVDGELQETQTCPALASGASHSDAFEPEDCPCGETLNVTVCADNYKVVDESDEENNCEVNIVECPPYIPTPPIEVDIRADGIASNIFNVADYTICPGTVTEDGVTIDNETAMGAVVAYCQDNSINVDITLTEWGVYLVQIGDDTDDKNNWMYAVNEVVPLVGGAVKVIVDGDMVHWYNSNLHYYVVLTTLDKTEIVVGETLTATVTWKDITGTYKLTGSDVFVADTAYVSGDYVGATNDDGNCTFQWSTPGTWYVYAVDPVHGSGIYNYPPVSFTCSTEEEPDLNVSE